MPYKTIICGIYCITTPSGWQYVGSSNNIYLRWAEHRGDLRRGVHHSTRLQAAWKKYGSKLAFSILEECDREVLNAREQEWINRLHPALNTTVFVNNVWTNGEIESKIRATYKTQAYKTKRSEIARRPRVDWKAVDCSNGKTYPCMAHAARDFRIRVSGIKHLAGTQRIGRLGVRFKWRDESWKPLISAAEARWETRRRNGHVRHTEETKAKMRAHRAHWVPSAACLDGARNWKQQRKEYLSSRPPAEPQREEVTA